jgi:hypothetical protein
VQLSFASSFSITKREYDHAGTGTFKSIRGFGDAYDATGEIWGFDTRATDVVGSERLLSDHYIVRRWATFLKRALKVLRHHGAQPPFRVEAGVVGLENVRWATQSKPDVLALDPQVVVETVDRSWGAERQAEVLALAYNALLDAFGKPHVSAAQLQQLIDASPD